MGAPVLQHWTVCAVPKVELDAFPFEPGRRQSGWLARPAHESDPADMSSKAVERAVVPLIEDEPLITDIEEAGLRDGSFDVVAVGDVTGAMRELDQPERLLRTHHGHSDEGRQRLEHRPPGTGTVSKFAVQLTAPATATRSGRRTGAQHPSSLMNTAHNQTGE